MQNANLHPSAFNWLVRCARYMNEAGMSDEKIREVLLKAIHVSKNLTSTGGLLIGMFNENIEKIDKNKFKQEIAVLQNKVQELVGK